MSLYNGFFVDVVVVFLFIYFFYSDVFIYSFIEFFSWLE